MTPLQHYFATTTEAFENQHKAELGQLRVALQHATSSCSQEPRLFRSQWPEMLYQELETLGWERNVQIALRTGTTNSTQSVIRRKISAIKNGLGIEHSFGHSDAMLYQIYGLFPHFAKAGLLTAGILIVPTKQFSDALPRGVSHMAQVIADLDARGPSNLDVPTLVIGFQPPTLRDRTRKG